MKVVTGRPQNTWWPNHLLSSQSLQQLQNGLAAIRHTQLPKSYLLVLQSQVILGLATMRGLNVDDRLYALLYLQGVLKSAEPFQLQSAP